MELHTDLKGPARLWGNVVGCHISQHIFKPPSETFLSSGTGCGRTLAVGLASVRSKKNGKHAEVAGREYKQQESLHGALRLPAKA